MLDSFSPSRATIPQIEVADYVEMGKLVTQWVADAGTRPASIDDLRRQVNGVAVIPDRITRLAFVQSTLDTLVLRLPVREMVEQSIGAMTDPMGDGRYPLPLFYSDHFRPGFGPVMTPYDTLMARVGDHTIAQCR